MVDFCFVSIHHIVYILSYLLHILCSVSPFFLWFYSRYLIDISICCLCISSAITPSCFRCLAYTVFISLLLNFRILVPIPTLLSFPMSVSLSFSFASELSVQHYTPFNDFIYSRVLFPFPVIQSLYSCVSPYIHFFGSIFS